LGKSNQPQDHSNRVTASERLDSWKEIAVYLKRGVTTVQRWEKHEGLPVHRLPHHKRGTAYAYKSELEDWLGKRSTTSGPGWFRFLSENRKTIVAVAAGVTLLLLVGLVAWMDIGSSSNPEGLNFQERDWVLIADFENRTGESVFDGVLEYALEREISNSQFVNVVPRERIEDTLRLMRKPLDTRVDLTLGREISLRDGGIKVLLTGRVEKLDSTYLLSVQVVDPSEGQVVATASEEAVGQKRVLSALQSLSNWSRETLGEKIVLIQQSNEKLEKVSTPSLRALQLFTKADALIIQGRSDLAEELLKQAVEIDPEFASAHIFLAHAIRNQWGPAEDRVDDYLKHAERAFQLAEATGDRERYFIHGSYSEMKGEWEDAVHAYEALLSLYPDHFWAVNNLAGHLRRLGQEQQLLTYQLRRADLRPSSFASNFNAVQGLLAADHHLIRAKPYIDRARNLITTEMLQANGTGGAIKIMLLPAYEAWLGGDPQAALVEIDKVLQTLKRAGVLGKRVRVLGQLYEALGQRQLAREWMSHGRWRRDRHWFLSLLAYDEGDYEAMKSHLKQYLEATKVSGAYIRELTPILMARAGLIAESEKTLLEIERQVTTGPPRPVPQQLLSARIEMLRGVLKLSQGDTADGIAMLESTLPLVPYMYRDRAFEILAEAYTRQGKLGAAIQLLEEASEKLPFGSLLDSPSLWLRFRWQLAGLYRQTGRAEDAQEIEDELRTLLAYADTDHPILRKLDRTEDLALREPTNN